MDDKLNDLNTNKAIKIRKTLDYIVRDGFSIFDKLRGEKSKIDIATYSNFFLRFIYCFEATKTLLVDFEKTKTYREYSIALILRASLLDLITVQYLKSFILGEYKTDETELSYESELKKILTSQIRRSFNIKKNTKEFKPEVFKNFVDHIRNSMAYLFNNDIPLDYNSPSKSLIYATGQHDISLNTIEKRLEAIFNLDDKKKFKNTFYLYDHYSKYDHFGVMGTLLMRMDINEIFQNILKSLYHLVDGIAFCIEFFKLEFDIENEYQSIRKHCGSLRGTVITEYLYLSDEYKNN